MNRVTELPPVERRIREVAHELHSVFKPIVESGAGPGGRPSTLARYFEIDRTLAARIVRAIGSPDISEVMHDVPSPEGLRILLSAAQRKGIDPQLSERAVSVIQTFERLIDEFPGGRSGLDATAAAWSEATQQRGENTARQAVFKSMSSLMGFFADVALETAIIQPSDEPGKVDTIYLLGKFGLRRLRAGGKITVFGVDVSQNSSEMNARTIDGKAATTSAEFLLKEFCTSPLPDLQSVHRTGMELSVLDEFTPPVNTPVTLVDAHVVRASGPLHVENGGYPVVESLIPRLPAKDLVFDLLIREDMFETDPVFTTTLHGFVTNEASPDSQVFRLDEVAVSAKIERLPLGLGDVACEEIPGYPAILNRVFSQTGWERHRFLGFRCRMRYPVPLVRLSYWLKPRNARP
jgi:hypothetical protein